MNLLFWQLQIHGKSFLSANDAPCNGSTYRCLQICQYPANSFCFKHSKEGNFKSIIMFFKKNSYQMLIQLFFIQRWIQKQLSRPESYNTLDGLYQKYGILEINRCWNVKFTINYTSKSNVLTRWKRLARGWTVLILYKIAFLIPKTN